MLKIFKTMEHVENRVSVPDFAYLSKQAASIGISWQTQNLIKCYAVLDDMFGYVVDTILSVYPESEDMQGGMLDDFKKAHSIAEKELMKLIATMMEQKLSESDFEEI